MTRERLPAALRDTLVALSAVELLKLGAPVPTTVVRDRLAAFDWKETLTMLGRIAAEIAHGNVRGMHRFAFAALKEPSRVNGIEEALADAARRFIAKGEKPEPIIFHDEAIYALHAMTIVHGGDSGAPTLADLTVLALCMNDYIDDESPALQSPDSDVSLRALAAVMARGKKLNAQRDMVHVLARAALMFEQPPDEDRIVGDAEWLEVQRRAFNGLTFEEHFDQLLGPLVYASQSWSTSKRRGADPPLIDRHTWLSLTTASQERGREYIAGLTMSRAEAASTISFRPDGVPRRTVSFFRKPFISLSDNADVCLSPRLLYDQLQLGTWSAFRTASKSSDRWLRDFGTIFELWVRRVVKLAMAESRPTANLRRHAIMSEKIGDKNEIEDVVLCDGRTAVLFSVKGALPKESVAHGDDLEDTMAWYERFFFAPRDPSVKRDHRGAVLKLHAKVERIRNGDWPQIPRDVYVIPVIITFEPLYENPALYAWIENRCRALGLLTDRTWPLCLGDIDDFEYMMAMAARDQDVIQVLRHKAMPDWRKRNLDALLFELAGRDPRVRLAALLTEFERVTDRMQRRLFPKTP